MTQPPVDPPPPPGAAWPPPPQPVPPAQDPATSAGSAQWHPQNLPPTYYSPAPEQKTNGFAIASLIFGIIGGCLLAVIFGIIALRQIKRTGQPGKGMAIAGLVLTGVWVVVAIAVAAAGGFDDAERDGSTGQITDPGKISTQDLAVGDCINDLASGTKVARIPAVPCSQPHQGEVFAEIKLNGAAYPGEQAVEKRASTSCFVKLKAISPQTYNDDRFGVFYFGPTEASWAQGDREITCVVKTEQRRTGSIKD